MNIKEKVLRFWRSDNEKISILRDILIALMAVLIVLLILWTYTGQWFAAPMVAIESGSMEHSNSPFGRLGTIDAGDMVLVQKVYTDDDVTTHGGNYGGAMAENGLQTYGDYGDVIIYKPLGAEDVSQIIHRVMTWVEVNISGDERTYTIEEYGIYNQKSLDISELGLSGDPNWTHSGFLTMGDNNPYIDQLPGSICPQPVKLSWITGKARQEIPWIGAINLFFGDLISGTNNMDNVHEDCLICLGIVIAVLISIPIILDLRDYFKKKNEQQ